MSTAQQSLVTVTVAGRALGMFATRTGGETSAEPTKYRPGGMQAEKVYPAPATHGDVTVTRAGGDRELNAWLRGRVGSAPMVVSDQPLDVNKVPFGKPEIFTGVLTSVNGGDSDAGSAEVRQLELTMNVTEVS